MERSLARIVAPLIDWTAAVLLGAACLFTAAQGFPLAVAVTGGAMVTLGGAFALSQVDRQPDYVLAAFSPEAFEFELPELLLDDPIVPERPVVDIAADPMPSETSRVVSLFGDLPTPTAVPSIPEPGVMVSRIEDFLSAGGLIDLAPNPVDHARVAATNEANAALHAALADIRRSLRRA